MLPGDATYSFRTFLELVRSHQIVYTYLEGLLDTLLFSDSMILYHYDSEFIIKLVDGIFDIRLLTSLNSLSLFRSYQEL